ncbi:MAG: insulinase family protein [Bacteroidetes bacterium]|nr:insulinase family protein [Bacteroidota bacterium]
MKKLTILCLFIISINVFSQHQAKTDKILPLDPSVRTGTLANGMKYYIKHNAKPEKRAELRLAVNSGATMENDDQQGLAHFVEHMAFNGSKNFKKNELVDYLEGIGTKFGADLNAYTSFDETVYMLQIPTDKEDIYKKGFLILEDWAHNLSFDSAEVEKERGVVLEEWRLGQGAFERMSRKFWPIMFKDSRYANRFPIGKPEILKNCKQSVLRQYYYDWYRPDLQSVIVVGDVDVDATEKLIKEQFSKIPAKKDAKSLKTWNVPAQKDLRVSVTSDSESPYNILQFMYFQPAEKLKTYDDYREKLKEELFNGMITARLNELSKKEDAPFMYSGAGYYGNVRNIDAYTCFALFANGKADKALAAVVEENERVKRFGFTATEFERSKKQILSDNEQQYNERDKTESKSIVNELVQNYLTGEAVPGIENEYNYTKDLLPGITIEEVNALAKKWIREKGENGMIVLMMAEKDGNKIPTEQEARSVFEKTEANTTITAYVDNAINEPLVAKKPKGQKVIKTLDKGCGVTEWTLGNGVRVLLKPTDFKDDQIVMFGMSWGGTNLYSDKDFQSARASAEIQDQMGYGKFNNIALDKYLQGKNASLSLGVGPVSEYINGNSGKKDLETLMQLMYVTFTMPRKDSAGFNSYIQIQKGFIQNSSSDPSKVFSDSISYIMASHNYRYAPQTEISLNEINITKAYEVFKERFLDPSDFVFTFVGSFKLDSIKPIIESYLGGISATMKHETAKDLGVKAPKGNLSKTVKKGNDPRSTVQLMWTGDFEFTRKNRFEMRALANLLNIRLRENLREDKGGVYGVGISPQTEYFPKGTYKYVCGFSCAPDNVEKLIAAAKDEINEVKKNGCNEINLGKIKETLLKEREAQLKENRFWLSYISSSDTYNESLNDIDVYNDWVKALNSNELKRLTNAYFNDKEFKRFVLDPEK